MHISILLFILITFGVTGIGFLAGYFIKSAFIDFDRDRLIRKNALILKLTKRVIEAEAKNG